MEMGMGMTMMTVFKSFADLVPGDVEEDSARFSSVSKLEVFISNTWIVFLLA